MDPGRIPGWAVDFADLLANAKDAVMPENYAGLTKGGVANGNSTKDVYLALYWACKRRSRFQQPKDDKFIFSNGIRSLPNRLRPGLWEVRLLSENCETLRRRLTRAVGRRCRHSGLVALTQSDGLMLGMQATLDVEGLPSLFKEKLASVTSSIISEHRLDVPLREMVLLDPLGATGRSAEHANFVKWWNQIAADMGVWRPDMSLGSEESNLELRSLSGCFTKAALDAFGLLLVAAKKGVKPEHFQKLSYWWRLPDSLRGSSGPEELIQGLARHLISRDSSEQLFIRELILDGCISGGLR